MTTKAFRPGQLVYFNGFTAYEKKSGALWAPSLGGSIGLYLRPDDYNEYLSSQNQRCLVLFKETICSVIKDTLSDIPEYIINRK